MIGTHFQFDTAVEIAIQRAVGAAAARPGAGDGVDLNLTADGIILQRAFRRGAEQGEIIVLHKEHVRAGVALLQHIISGQRRWAGQREAAGRNHLEDFPGADRALHFAHHRAVLFIALVNVAAHFGHGGNR